MPLVRPVPIKPVIQGINCCLSKRRIWCLEEDWVFGYGQESFVIRKGFLFDGASIPSCLAWWRNPSGLLFISALIHDCGYQYGGFLKLGRNGNIVKIQKSRNEIDIIFREISNDHTCFRYLTYFALYLVGGRAWNQYRNKSI
jgi:hypothetical protein